MDNFDIQNWRFNSMLENKKPAFDIPFVEENDGFEKWVPQFAEWLKDNYGSDNIPDFMSRLHAALNLKELNEEFSKVIKKGDTITPDMWDQTKIAAGEESGAVTKPEWFKVPHQIVNFQESSSRVIFGKIKDTGDISYEPEKRGLSWVNNFLKSEFKVEF